MAEKKRKREKERREGKKEREEGEEESRKRGIPGIHCLNIDSGYEEICLG